MQPGDLSPDRLWRWDGAHWVPAGPAAPPPPPAAASQFPVPPAAAASRRSLPATAGGVIAMLGAITIIVACALPYIHYTDSTSPSSPSIFNTGFAPGNFFAAEPVGVALIAIGAGVVLVAWMRRIPRAIASGALLAYGVQTFLLFSGYVAYAVGSSSAHVGPAGFVGELAGVLLFAGGVVPAVTLFARDPAKAV